MPVSTSHSLTMPVSSDTMFRDGVLPNMATSWAAAGGGAGEQEGGGENQSLSSHGFSITRTLS